MTDVSIVTQLPLWSFTPETQKTSIKPPDLHTLAQLPQFLPVCVSSSPTVMRGLDRLGPLDWSHFPERNLLRDWGQVSIPYAALAAAELIRLDDPLKRAFYENECLKGNWSVRQLQRQMRLAARRRAEDRYHRPFLHAHQLSSDGRPENQLHSFSRIMLILSRSGRSYWLKEPDTIS